MWRFHDRRIEGLNRDTCRAEIASFSSYGQLVPALGRPLSGNADHDVELIYGARRLFAARESRTPLLVDVRKLSDREAIVAMDIENRQRADISPYERGVAYAGWLRAGLFKSQHELAAALNVSPSQISRLLPLARLPEEVVRSFETPQDICEGWGLDLMEKLEDRETRERLMHRARALARLESRLPGADVFRQLISASSSARRSRGRRDEVVKLSTGLPLYRIRYQTNSICFVVPVDTVTDEMLGELRASISEILGGPEKHGGTVRAAQPRRQQSEGGTVYGAGQGAPGSSG
jgi:ParB/RepB/Spo0J family partition protein